MLKLFDPVYHFRHSWHLLLSSEIFHLNQLWWFKWKSYFFCLFNCYLMIIHNITMYLISLGFLLVEVLPYLSISVVIRSSYKFVQFNLCIALSLITKSCLNLHHFSGFLSPNFWQNLIKILCSAYSVILSINENTISISCTFYFHVC